jgi:hypothetical protein
VHLGRFVRGHQMGEEAALRVAGAMQGKEPFVYSCFLTLVFDMETKDDTLRIICGFHLSRLTELLLAPAQRSCVGCECNAIARYV